MDSKHSLKKVFSVFQLGKLQNGGHKVKKSELHRASKYGCLETVKTLVENGADANLLHEHFKTKTKLTPLELAVLGGHVEVVEYLIKVTSNADIKSLIVMACKNGNIEMVEFLTTKLEVQTVEEKQEDTTPNGEMKYLRRELLEAHKKIFKLSCQVTIQSLDIKRMNNRVTECLELEKEFIKSQKELFYRTTELCIKNLDSHDDEKTKMEM